MSFLEKVKDFILSLKSVYEDEDYDDEALNSSKEDLLDVVSRDLYRLLREVSFKSVDAQFRDELKKEANRQAVIAVGDLVRSTDFKFVINGVVAQAVATTIGSVDFAGLDLKSYLEMVIETAVRDSAINVNLNQLFDDEDSIRPGRLKKS